MKKILLSLLSTISLSQALVISDVDFTFSSKHFQKWENKTNLTIVAEVENAFVAENTGITGTYDVYMRNQNIRKNNGEDLSKQIIKQKKFNENNLGIIISLKSEKADDYGLKVGYIHKNSFNQQSFLMAYFKELYSQNDFQITLNAGGISGYEKPLEREKYDWITAVPTVDGKIFDLYVKTGEDRIEDSTIKTWRGIAPLVNIDISYKNFKIGLLPNIGGSFNKPTFIFGLTFKI